jgi:hypothetical protein
MSRSHKRPQGQGFHHPAPDPAVYAQSLKRRGRGAAWVGFWLGLLAYLLLSMQQPLGWGILVWVLLAFLIVPGLIGLLIGKKLGAEPTAPMKFWAGLKGVAWAMAFYAFLNPILLLGRLNVEGENGARLFAVLLVTVVFALLAGGVAGLASALTAKRAPKGESV